MSCTMYIRLLLCMAVILPCCRGFKDPCKSKDRQILDLCELALEINSTNWYRHLNLYYVNEEIKNSIEIVENRYRSEDILTDINHLVIGSPYHGQLIDFKPSKEEHSKSRNAEIIIEATRNLRSTYCLMHGLSDVQCAKDLTKVKLSRTSLGGMCLSEYYNETLCDGNDLNYRSYDGSCNNLKRSFLGKATSPYKRLLLPAYTDGIDNMPEELPNPRVLSTEFVKDENSTDQAKTMLMAYWAIFIGHDLSHTVASRTGEKDKVVKCCDSDKNKQYTLNKHIMSCKPITIPDDDKFFKSESDGCMNYVRSMPAVRSDCTFGPMEQMNRATHYLDASMIYGNSKQQTLSLRKMSGGELLMNKTETDLQYLPLDTTESNACQHGNGTCFRAGDIRANALPQLTVLHTLWMRQHNHIANQMAFFNPHWNDEKVFQEAKKIVTAYIQHITYNEWLPALLGVNYTKENGLGLLKEGYSNAYDETADPTVSNSFATAILPFAYSMLSDNISLYTEDRVNNESLSLKEYYNHPVDLLLNNTDELIRGLVTQNTQKVDMLFSQTITNHLFSIHPNDSFGMDIFSLDIQRSRDHGIPSYAQFRKYCGLKDIENEQDLSEIMVEGATDKILKQYKHWNDIDLLVGALLEKHADDAMVGPTMRCIIRDQFVRTRIADKYFYDLPGVFTEDQLVEIRKMTHSTVMCSYGNNITTIQSNAFLKPTLADEMHVCNSNTTFPTIFLSYWSDLALTVED